jgi:hypothetical protein
LWLETEVGMPKGDARFKKPRKRKPLRNDGQDIMVNQNRSQAFLAVVGEAQNRGVHSSSNAPCPRSNQSLGDEAKDGAVQVGNGPYRAECIATARSAGLLGLVFSHRVFRLG